MLGHYELTVKHIAPDGEINIYPTSKVRIVPDSLEFPTRMDHMMVQVIQDGEIYVMNSAGKTVHSHDFRLS